MESLTATETAVIATVTQHHFLALQQFTVMKQRELLKLLNDPHAKVMSSGVNKSGYYVVLRIDNEVSHPSANTE